MSDIISSAWHPIRQLRIYKYFKIRWQLRNQTFTPFSGLAVMRFVVVYLPKWELYKEELNKLPISHAEWDYYKIISQLCNLVNNHS